MTQRVKDRIINGGVSFLTALIAVVVAFALSSTETKTIRIDDKLDKKADIEYVDKQDASLQCNIDDLKADTESDIQTLTNTINTRFDDQNKKLDIMIKLIEK